MKTSDRILKYSMIPSNNESFTNEESTYGSTYVMSRDEVITTQTGTLNEPDPFVPIFTRILSSLTYED